ncbi:TetR/AcrR family transcriptional regulator [Sphingobacterium thalpophilum]|uniref:TetR/AcrR family transcriptional regulator n=1 Tax=Sphingobacterium thalpophilum TaxID=259 RepID=UPI0024A64108|nr:TetR/AcrR family transcriptional regulator [Sphingobacterium thalpophilum]
MTKKGDKIGHILHVTIDLLSKEGGENLSMRGVAKASNISLSNLQYYYPNKEALLKAAIAQYFNGCQEAITARMEQSALDQATSGSIFFEQLLDLLLYNAKESDQAIMFREISALSSRNKDLELAIDAYYKDYCAWLTELIRPHAQLPEKIVCLLVPYLEGYAGVGTVLPLSKNEVVQMLLDIIRGTLNPLCSE